MAWNKTISNKKCRFCQKECRAFICVDCIIKYQKERIEGRPSGRRDSYWYEYKCDCGNVSRIRYASLLLYSRKFVSGKMTCDKCCHYGTVKGYKFEIKVKRDYVKIDGGCTITKAGSHEFLSKRCGESDLTCQKYNECMAEAIKYGWAGWVCKGKKIISPVSTEERACLVKHEQTDFAAINYLFDKYMKKVEGDLW